MKRENINISKLVAAVFAMTSLVACQKNADKAAGDRSLTAGITAACDCATAPPAIGDASDSTISGQITADITLSNTKNYKLSGLVFVTGGAKVSINAGARIVGLAGSGVSGGTPGGGLVVTRGSKIEAVGTSSCPIIFTSYRYNNNPQPGDWSGLVVLGNSTSNQPFTTQVEGIGSYAPAGVDIGYGGNTPADNSGILQFVRIEYAGYELETDKEINGLTLAGVGSGTTIDYVEVFKANDDAFEWFGGTVNASHLIAVDALDDMFDTDHGYTGTISYALGLSDTSRVDKSQSNGFESDNSNISAYTQTPNTHPVYNHVTIIGVENAARASVTAGAPSLTGKYGRAAQLRRNAEFDINNSIFLGFNFGIALDDEKPASPATNTVSKYVAGTSTLTNNFVHAFYTGTTPTGISPFILETNGTAATAAGFKLTDASFYTAASAANTGYVSSNANVIGLLAPFDRSSVAATNFITNLGTAADDARAGAFPDGIDWTIVNDCYSWTRYQ